MGGIIGGEPDEPEIIEPEPVEEPNEGLAATDRRRANRRRARQGLLQSSGGNRKTLLGN